jgi:TRAP-type C4-dicarboxylate transport system substrate-binding protein
MRKQRQLLVASIVLLIFVGVSFGLSSTVHAKEVTLRLIVPSPPDDKILTSPVIELAKRFNERAKGQYKIEVFPGGALAKIPEYFDSIRVGAVEMASIDWSIFGFLDPKLSAVSTPFLVDTLKGANYMTKALLPLHDSLFQEKFNAKALGMFSVDGLIVVSSKPIKTLNDWKGLLAGVSAPPSAALFKGLGASPVNIVWTDLYESLQKHVIDASAMTMHGAIVVNLMDVCDYMTLFFGHPNFNGYMINLDVWKKMPANIQKILQEEIGKTCKFMEERFLKLTDEDLAFLKQKGKKVYALPKAERDKWVAQLAPYRDKELANLGDFGKKVKQAADEANKKFPYVEQAIK